MRHELARETVREDEASGRINWSGYEHRQLYDMIHTADPGSMGETAQRWAELAARTEAATARVNATMQRLLQSWRGGSATRAAGSASKLTGWAATAATTMRGVGTGLDAYTSAILEARNAMPEPGQHLAVQGLRESYGTGANVPGALLLAGQVLLDDHLPSKRQADRAKAEAVRAMERYEAASTKVRDALPTFTDAPEVSTLSTVDNLTPVPAAPKPVARTVPEMHAVTRPTVAPVASPSVSPSSGVFPGTTANSGIGEAADNGSFRGSLGGSLSGSLSGALGAPEVAPPPSRPAQPVNANAAPGVGGGLFPGAGMGTDTGYEHQNRFGGDGLDLLDDLPPACPPVIGQ